MYFPVEKDPSGVVAFIVTAGGSDGMGVSSRGTSGDYVLPTKVAWCVRLQAAVASGRAIASRLP